MRHTSDHMAVDHVALALFHNESGMVLIQQQRPTGGEPYWVVPGDLVKPGELVVEALRREVREEAGVELTADPQLICISQIDRPQQQAQTLAFLFLAPAWQGTLAVADPDGEGLQVELVPHLAALERLRRNGGWPGMQEPLRAFLQGQSIRGRMWFYRDDGTGQRLIARV